MGATLALPLLGIDGPGRHTAGENRRHPARRLGFVFMPWAVIKADGPCPATPRPLSAILSRLLRQGDVTAITNLELQKCLPRSHARPTRFLSAARLN